MANILVTDDSSFLRRRTCNILKAGGHHITEAVNGIECMYQIEQDGPDVLFLDLVMPEMDGLAVLLALKEQGHPLPVIVLTADIQDTIRDQCLQLGAVGFINKPPKEDEVLNALDVALNKKGSACAKDVL